MSNVKKENVNDKNINEKNPEADSVSSLLLIEDFTQNGFKALVEATRHSNSLPQNRDWDFYNTHESFRHLMNSEGEDNILQLINTILTDQSKSGNIKNRHLEEKIELIIEANDVILERVAHHLDELEGIKKKPELPVEIQSVSAILSPVVHESWNRIDGTKFIVSSSATYLKGQERSVSGNQSQSYRLLTAKNIQRPQKCFKDRIDNSTAPWQPRIRDKPNSLKPLAVYLERIDDCGEDREIFCHPYEFELERFESSVEQLNELTTPVYPKPLKDTPLRLIQSVEDLNELVVTLRGYTELAIDLEHHSYRTFLGITCLLQISTADTDYLVDTLLLRNDLHVLNEVFTKPSIVKVFHGADNDVLWLQRDLSLYIVNMFDTHQAAKLLAYPHLSLAYLLRKFCQIDPNKHFQLADWRIRPLPEELQTYAREDTHYLLYIYHMLRNELLAKANGSTHLLKAVFERSRDLCRKRYSKPALDADSHLELYRKCKKMFDNRQMYALKHLYRWRDSIARLEDESVGFVLPNHMLLQISELLPREMQGVLACCNPIPPLVRANLLELHKIVLQARDQATVKPILIEGARARGTTQLHTNKINVDSPLNCPHDLLRSEEFRDDLPTLLYYQPCINIITTTGEDLAIENHRATVTVFHNTDNLKKTIPYKMKFLSPYERYKLVKSYVQAAEDNKQEKTVAEEQTNVERITQFQPNFEKEIDQLAPVNIETTSITTFNDGMKKRKRKLPSEFVKTSKADGDGSSKQKKKKRDNTPPQELHHQVDNSMNQKQRRRKNRDKGVESMKPFDYTAVDFQQFHSGTHGNTRKEKRMHFRDKNNKKKKQQKFWQAQTTTNNVCYINNKKKH